MATPALSQGAMYLRTSMSLLAVGRAPRALTDADRVRRGLVDDRQKNYSTFAALTEGSAARGSTVAFTITARGSEHAAFAGEWIADVPGAQNEIVIKLTLEANRVSGDLLQGTLRVLKVDGTVTGNRLVFSALMPVGNRTVTLTGTLTGDEIAFVRTVKINERGAPGGRGFFGVDGAPSFVARRTGK
jgi:hypothetical protein